MKFYDGKFYNIEVENSKIVKAFVSPCQRNHSEIRDFPDDGVTVHIVFAKTFEDAINIVGTRIRGTGDFI